MFSRGVIQFSTSLSQKIPSAINPMVMRCVCTRHPVDIPDIPTYQRFNEDMDTKRARLLYQSRKRGMLENDLLLSTFARRYLDNFTDQELDLYDALINSPSNDWDLYYWVVGKKDTPNEFNNDVMNLLKEHAKNTSKENRTRQPSLY